MKGIIEEVKSRLVEAIEKDQIVLPTLPEIALQVREAANDANVTTKKLGDLIGSDAALSARIIKVANSPLVRGVQSIENLPTAISRLGIAYSCNLAVGLAMEQMFQATNELVDTRMRDVWKHGTEVAAISAVLTQNYTNLRTDQATLAGLVHQLGILPILTYAEGHDIFLEDNEAGDLDELIEALHPQLGELILKTWSFPAALVPVPAQHLDIYRDSEVTDYVDVVIVAKLQCYAGKDHPLADIDWKTVPAFKKLGLDPEDNEGSDENLSEQMQQAMSALR